jgi:hypothetical protein
MLLGRFGDTSGRPHIEGRLSVPRIGISADISFVIDTGSDYTVLMPLDAARISLDYSRLGKEVDAVGIGGLSRDFVEDALIAFTDGIAVFIYETSLHIASPSVDIITIPSILGRDIINRWSMVYCYPERKIEIHNHTADHIAAIEPDETEATDADIT